METIYTYDCRADIEKCLNCDKVECNNCLGNFYSAKEDLETLDSTQENGCYPADNEKVED